jgi:hypothetical protein
VYPGCFFSSQIVLSWAALSVIGFLFKAQEGLSHSAVKLTGFHLGSRNPKKVGRLFKKSTLPVCIGWSDPSDPNS